MRLSLASAAVVLSIALFSPSLIQAGSTDKRLDIYWIDVEGGAATLIVTPAGESILIERRQPRPTRYQTASSRWSPRQV